MKYDIKKDPTGGENVSKIDSKVGFSSLISFIKFLKISKTGPLAPNFGLFAHKVLPPQLRFGERGTKLGSLGD